MTSSYGSSSGFYQGRDYRNNSYQSGGYVRQGYPPIHLPPVKQYPPDPFIDQFPLPEALVTGTLFRWLYDPYENPYECNETE